MLTVAVPKRNKLPNIIVLTPKDGVSGRTCSAYGSKDVFLFSSIGAFAGCV